ncbi:MAG: DOPA 4,5-dioxygenase family protein [Novosphingobium sp.]
MTKPYHAHIYYHAAERPAAAALREAMRAATGGDALAALHYVGELRDAPVGPHPIPQFEIHFDDPLVGAVEAAIRAAGLTALIHPLTDDDLADHTTLGRWIGEPVDLDLSVLDPPGHNQGVARYGVSDF